MGSCQWARTASGSAQTTSPGPGAGPVVADIIELIARAPWREAVTYRDSWPHEYVVVKKDGQEAPLAAFCQVPVPVLQVGSGSCVTGRPRSEMCSDLGFCLSGWGDLNSRPSVPQFRQRPFQPVPTSTKKCL